MSPLNERSEKCTDDMLADKADLKDIRIFRWVMLASQISQSSISSFCFPERAWLPAKEDAKCMPDFRLRIAPLRNFCLIPPNSRTGGIQQSYEEALKIFQNALGDNHLFTTYSRDTLGSLLEARFCERALEVHLRVLGEDDSGTATSLSDLGNLLQEMGELAGARSHLEQTLEIRRLMLGNEHPCTASSLSDLGVLLQKMGNSNEARPYIEQAEGATPAALSAPTKTAQDHPRGGKKMTRFPRDGLTASIGSDRHSISSVVSWDPGFRYP